MSTAAPETSVPPLRRARDGATLALGFLTIVPVRLGARVVPLGDAAPFFPLVGAMVGAAAGGARAASDGVLGPAASSAIAVSVLVALTGALHLDGLADSADAVGARGGGTTRRLAVMRDPSTGVFGVLAIVLWVLLLTTTIAPLDADHATRSLIVAGAVSRCGVLWHARVTPPARRDGLGLTFDPGTVALAAGTVAAAVIATAADAAIALAPAGLVAVATSLAARRLVGGRTGDTLGATVALTELAACLAIAAV